ncbi:MAG: recombinase family protein, partial [Ruthenibacterium lactatiformans]
ELEASLLQEQIAKPLLTREQILFWFERFRQGDPSDPAYQQKIIDCFVNSVYIFDDRLIINFNYRDGDKLVSLQEVKSSFLGGNRSPHRNGLCAIQKAPLRRGFSHASASFPHPPTKFCGASFRGVQWHLCFSVCMVSFFI